MDNLWKDHRCPILVALFAARVGITTAKILNENFFQDLGNSPLPHQLGFVTRARF
jgi:hypothetical protein